MDTTKKAPPLYLIKITSGEHAGRFVDFYVPDGALADPNGEIDCPRPLLAPKYSSWGRFSPNRYFDWGAPAVQAELKKAGFSSELIPAPPMKPIGEL
jgi:hypothetical protein